MNWSSGADPLKRQAGGAADITFATAAAIGLLVAGCRADDATAPVADLPGSRWHLAAFEPPEQPAATPVGTITLAFGAERDEVTGSAGCNLYRADYRLDGSALWLSPLDTSRMLCSNGRVMADERDFTLALATAGRLERSGDVLLLDAAGGWRLRFVPADPP